MLCEWFIQYLLPLFCDTALLAETTIEDIRFIFAIVVTCCAVSLLIIIPYKWIKYLLSGGKRRRI